jgi:hypothetical protein
VTETEVCRLILRGRGSSCPNLQYGPHMPRQTPCERGQVLDLQPLVRVRYELRRLDTGASIRTHANESPALALVRDVVRLDSGSAASQFELRTVDEQGRTVSVVSGEALVRRALEDRGEP